jgi:hypothetical protein
MGHARSAAAEIATALSPLIRTAQLNGLNLVVQLLDQARSEAWSEGVRRSGRDNDHVELEDATD